jgi:hypothetical protein
MCSSFPFGRAFYDHKGQHLIRDNEDVTAGKQFIHHEHRGAGMLIVQTMPSPR